jgi:Sec-independent protein translocase protein TatA
LFGIGGTELLIIAVFAFLIFGPDKIPGLIKTANRFWREFQKTKQSVETLVRAEMFAMDPELLNPFSPESGADAVSRLPKVQQSTIIPDDDEEEEEEE